MQGGKLTRTQPQALVGAHQVNDTLTRLQQPARTIVRQYRCTDPHTRFEQGC